MKNFEESNASPGIMLAVAYPQIVEKLISYLKKNREDLVQQIKNILIEPQALNGSPDSFSFMGYTVPRLNFEQRQSAEMKEAEIINIDLDKGHIRIDLDDFGKINWFYVTDISEMYTEIQKCMIQWKV